VLNKLPKSAQPKAKEALHEIWMAETRENAQVAFDLFVKTYEDKYPGAVQCLLKDQDALLSFTTFLQSTGRANGQRIRSNHASPRYAIVLSAQRGVYFFESSDVI